MTTSPVHNKPRARKKNSRKWHLVTNHQNMLYMLAANLIMSPHGFGTKYYSDSLDFYPGLIPLFPHDVIPDDAVQHSIRERKHLLPCIASFDLSDLSGPIQVLRRDGRTRIVDSQAIRRLKNDVAILIPAPLPTTLLSTISFRSDDDKESFERAARDVSNVDLAFCKLEISDLFARTDQNVVLPRELQAELPFDKRDTPELRQAIGGALAMLYHIANRSNLGLAAFRSVIDGRREEDDDLIRSKPMLERIIAALRGWIDTTNISDQADIGTRLFLGVVHSLSSEPRTQTAVDDTLRYLESQLRTLSDDKYRARLEALIEDMRACHGLGGGTNTELFDRHEGPLSRSLLLFCLRQTCEELLEFSHELLNDADYILAAVLFGVRDSWLKLPKELRNTDLSAYVAYRMADAEQREPGNESDGLSVRRPPRPKPLRELFTSSGTALNHQDVALELAQKCKWNDCILTRVTLAEGVYPSSFERNGLQVDLPGEVISVTPELVEGRFLRRLRQWPLVDRKIEVEIRMKLMSLQANEQPQVGRSSSCE